jgi:ATP-independent RNA helicase DbpA
MGFPGTQIGKINVTDMATYVAVDRAIADKALGKLNAGLVKGKRVRARRIEGITE